MTQDRKKTAQLIADGKAVLGIELGSTRIKAVLIDEAHHPIAQGGFGWENQLKNGIWTYDLDLVWQGIESCYSDLKKDIQEKYHVTPTSYAAIGFSAMMHGYLVFDSKDRQLAEFRTWRNTITADAAAQLTKLFAYNIPQRWSIAHVYQAILNGEEHVKDIAFMTTLSGYVHWKMTGEKVLGIGDAVGMMPVDPDTRDYNKRMQAQFDTLLAEHDISWKINDILPKILLAGAPAGLLTEEGARLLDPSGDLKAGIPLCPPEGDAGTGMVATNSVAVRTGNVSAGTSVFGMLVLEKGLSRVYTELDMVTTPAGDPVAMAHCNNCTSDLNGWVSLFASFGRLFGCEADMGQIYETLFKEALKGDDDCGGLLAYNYLSGEHVTNMEEGRPLFVRKPDADFSLANFMKVHLYTALGALKTGMDILMKEEGVKVDRILGHGGFFKTEGVGQRILAAALNTPVAVMETAGEGGAWGIALLASYLIGRADGESLSDYLNAHVFAGAKGSCVDPIPEDVASYEKFMQHYREGLAIERAAVDSFR